MFPAAVGDDSVLLLAVLAGLCLTALVLHVTAQAVRALAPVLPRLPDADCPPDGLGRLVPVQAQVEQEARRGVVDLELWLAASWRERRSAGGPAERRVRRTPGVERRRAPAHEAG